MEYAVLSHGGTSFGSASTINGARDLAARHFEHCACGSLLIVEIREVREVTRADLKPLAPWFNCGLNLMQYKKPYSAFRWEEWGGGVKARRTAEDFFHETEYPDPDGLEY
jgi:hypothetical protein